MERKMPKAWVQATVKPQQAAEADEAHPNDGRRGKAEPGAEAINHFTPNEVKHPSEVNARINMSADVAGAGLCPECRKPMEKAFASGIPVYRCTADRIALPVPDQE